MVANKEIKYYRLLFYLSLWGGIGIFFIRTTKIEAFGFDLAPFYGSIKLLHKGIHDIYSFSIQEEIMKEARQYGYAYSFRGIIAYHPFFLLLLTPFSCLFFPYFALVWFFINILILADLLRRIYRMGGWVFLSFFSVYLFFFSQLPTILWYGQTTLLCFYLLFLYFFEEKTVIQALALSLGFFLKPHFFLLPLVLSAVRRKYLIVLLFLLFSGLFNLLPMLIWGPQVVASYVKFLKTFSTTLYTHISNQSLVAILWRIMAHQPAGEVIFRLIRIGKSFWYLVNLVRIILIVVMCGILWKEIFLSPSLADFAFINLSLLLHNFCWPHYTLLHCFFILFFLKNGLRPLWLMLPLVSTLPSFPVPLRGWAGAYILFLIMVESVIVSGLYARKSIREAHQ